MKQAILWYLPGYAFDGRRIISTGAALPPSQHIDPETGELMYYVRPLFESGPNIGMFIKHSGVVSSLDTTKDEEQQPFVQRRSSPGPIPV